MPRVRPSAAAASGEVAPEVISAVRKFNRFYTRQIGVLNEAFLDSEFSLAEGRVLFEVAHREEPTATDVGRALGLDAGYVSRILRSFQRRRLIVREPSATDARQRLLRLTKQGRAAIDGLDRRSCHEVGAMLGRVDSTDRARLLGAMRTIEDLLEDPAAAERDGQSRESRSARTARTPFILRPHQDGDMGWVVHRHAVLYAQEHGWVGFEGLVAKICAEFLDRFDPVREHCWIAERDGEIIGSVFLVQKSKTVAKLRLLLVEPKARGLGLGRRLVGECVRFARLVGYRKITLWTHANLTAARHLYQEAGFVLVESHPAHSFGHDVVSETWDLTL